MCLEHCGGLRKKSGLDMHHDRKRSGHARLLAEVPSTRIEDCEGYKFQEESGSPGSLVPRSTVFTYPQYKANTSRTDKEVNHSGTNKHTTLHSSE